MRFVARAGRLAGITLIAGLLLASCDKGPDRTKVAADLQKSVEDYLAQIEGPADKRTLSHASVLVTPQQDTGYLVAIDGLKLAQDAEGYLDIGKISYVLTPKDDQTYSADKLSVATDIPFKTADGQSAGGVKFTNKAFSGVWLRAAESFIKLDLQFADIDVKDIKQGDDLKMAGITLSSDSTDKGSGRWDQLGKLTITGFSAAEDNGSRLDMASIDITSAIQGLKLLDYTAKLKAMRQAAVQPAAASSAGGTAGAADTATGNATTGDVTKPAGTTDAAANPAAAPIEEFIKALPGLLTGSTIDLHMNGVAYKDAGGQSAFELAKVGVAATVAGFDQPKSTFKLTIDHDGLVLHTPEAETDFAKASLPGNGALTVSLIDLPTADLVSTLADGASAYATADPTQIDAKTALFVAKFQQLLQQDGVKLKIEPSHLTSATANLTADGDFVLQPAAIYGATGGLNIAITGIDQMMALAQKEAGQNPAAAQAAGMLQALLAYAAREQGSDGKPVDRFKVDVPQSGQVTVNGKPLQF